MYRYIYKLLIGLHRKKATRGWNLLWKHFIDPNKNKPVVAVIHGEKMIVNCGYTYPIYTRLFSNFNNPLLELVYQVRQSKGKPITIIDVGAAVGDTVLLLEKNILGAFRKVVCIDGDKEFFGYLKKNMAKKPYVTCVNVLLSDINDKEEKKLVRTHSGTASAQGSEQVIAKTLDGVVDELHLEEPIDVLKIDVDGFDGKVLRGAKNILSTMHPYVIFEWHPLLIKQTDNHFLDAFTVLDENGYNQFLFFTKYGIFNHFMEGVDEKELHLLIQLSLNNRHDADWHYDVIALPRHTTLNLVSLAECFHAKNKVSPY